jgi:hypothetical protein
MNDFAIDFVSDINRDHLMVEIFFRKQRLCQISKELGNEHLEIEFLSDIYVLPSEVLMKFSLNDFEAILKEAKDSLIACE